MHFIKNTNPPTKAFFTLLLPTVYLVLINKLVYLGLYFSFGLTMKDYNSSYIVLTFNILAGIFFLYETIVFLYMKRRKHNEY